jgi:hypothetical protein
MTWRRLVMGHLMRALLIVVPALALRAVPPVSAQSAGGQARGAPTPACALLSVAEIRSITGRNDYPDAVDGDPDGEGAGGGSSCQYGGADMMPGPDPPLLSVVLIKGKDWTAASRRFTLPAGCSRESVAGVGDDAFFESCPASRSKRSPPLYVKAGSNDLIVQIDIDPPATQASARAVVIALAKAAVAKLH